MPLANPLSAADFANRFMVQDAQIVQQFNQQRSMPAGGDTGYSDRAVPLWRAEITTEIMENARALGIMAVINSRAGGLKHVLLYDYRLPFPSSDPKGQIVNGIVPAVLQTWVPWDDGDGLEWDDDAPWGGSDPSPFVPKVGTITDRLTVAFTGFPPRYPIPAGTYFSIVFDTSRYYLGQFAEDAVADGSGAVSAVSIWPPLPSSISTGDDVEVRKPCGKFKIVPNTAYPSKASSLHSQITFTAEQTYKP